MRGVFLDTSERKLDDKLEGASHPSYLIPLSRHQLRVAFLQKFRIAFKAGALGLDPRDAPADWLIHCSALYWTPVHGTVLCCHPPHVTLLHCTLLYYTVLQCALLHCNQVKSRAAHFKNNAVNLVYFSVEIYTANRSETRQHLSSIRLILK
jgi:hypothetical protein